MYLDRTFHALSDGTRRGMLSMLSRKGELTASELGAPFDISQPTASKHLRVLEQAGIVRSSRVGRESHFTYVPDPVDHARSYLDTVSGQWDDALSRLKAFVEP